MCPLGEACFQTTLTQGRVRPGQRRDDIYQDVKPWRHPKLVGHRCCDCHDWCYAQQLGPQFSEDVFELASVRRQDPRMGRALDPRVYLPSGSILL